MVGMLAAAFGRPRGADNADLHDLEFTVRVDNPGRMIRDWHTVGGGQPKHRTVLTADGKRRGQALIFEDWYLADAAFTVAVAGDGPLIAEVARALARPVFPPSLGRRNCPPAAGLVVHRTEDPEGSLRAVPLHRPVPRGTASTVKVDYVYEQAPPDAAQAAPTRTLDDGWGPGGRRVTRPVWDVEREMPAALCTGYGAWLEAVHAAA